MNKDKISLEEAIKTYNELKQYKEKIESIDVNFFFKFAETVLQALESYKKRYELAIEQNIKDYKNSISKKEIEDKIKAYEKLIYDISESEHYSHEIPMYKHDIQVLQELLEDK